jgi:signal transduction histidine kinase
MTRVVLKMTQAGRSGTNVPRVEPLGARALRRLGLRPTDLRLPVALAVVAQADVWLPPPVNLGHVVGPRAVVAGTYVVTSLLLAWRRQAPLQVLGLVVAVQAVEYLCFGAPEGLGSLLPVVVASYAVGRHARPSAVGVGAPLVLLGISIHELTDPESQFGGANAVFYLVVAAAWPIGRALRTSEEGRQDAEEQARALARRRRAEAEHAVAEERTRIARELHDVVGHGLSVIVLQLVAAIELLRHEATTPALVKVTGAETSARHSLAEIRRLLALLGPLDDGSTSPQPGLKDVPQLVEDTRAAGASITLVVEGDPRPVQAGIELAAYRIVQESLTNVLKHAQPPHASVRLAYCPDLLEVEVVDRGGAPAGRARPAAGDVGRGLAGVRERVALYDGAVKMGPRQGGGFGILARLPTGEPA